MFSIFRKGNTAQIQIEPKVEGAPTWVYTGHVGDFQTEVAAQLVVNAMNERLQKVLSTIRRDEYNKGFADAKAKRAKRTYFFEWF